MRTLIILLLWSTTNLSGCLANTSAARTKQMDKCVNAGWHHEIVQVNGVRRQFFWQAPHGSWQKGAILVLHGGGGHADQFCNADWRFLTPQVDFAERAVSQGFAVFLLDSSDQSTDIEGRACGKIWDDEVRDRPNLDLPLIENVIGAAIPRLRPPESQPTVFMTGLSSGGYMTVRAATHFNDQITGFAPISNGDPYGWHRDCIKGLTLRKNVNGAGYDNETNKQIVEENACEATQYPHENPWEGNSSLPRPRFLALHHRYDGINDFSCHLKVVHQLQRHGYEGTTFVLDSNTKRSLWNHLWQIEYNQPILDFFNSLLTVPAPH